MRIAVLFLFWVALAWPLECGAENASDLIETFPTGYMNWTRSVIVAKGIALSGNNQSQDEEAQSLSAVAQVVARDNILRALGNIRIDDRFDLSTVFSRNAALADRVKEMVAIVDEVDQKSHRNGGIEATLQFSLLGGFSQLILPAEIQQVQPITAISPVSPADNGSASAGQPAGSEAFSGLIVDARGISARPALVPVLVDETGKEVYSPAFVSREYAVQNGVCKYLRSMEGIQDSPRVAPKPLMLKGLRAIGLHQCDIVISNADAFKLRDASSNLNFLKQCRVIIVLD